MSRKVLVLASGGLDSSVVMALYKNLGYEVHMIYFDYGNINASKEMDKLNSVCHKLELDPEDTYKVSLDVSWSNGGCLDKDNPNPYIEMRNLIFLSNAISIAEAKGIDTIAIGFIDAMDYPDTSYGFLTNINQLSMESTGISIVAPLKELNKVGVYRLSKKLGISLNDTFSCNYSNTTPCGECLDCQDILELIKDEQIPDEENPFKIAKRSLY